MKEKQGPPFRGTAVELARIARQAKPHLRYAIDSNGTGVAAWTDGRWVQVAGLGLDGAWASLPYELLVNGKPTHEQTDWTEVL